MGQKRKDIEISGLIIVGIITAAFLSPSPVMLGMFSEADDSWVYYLPTESSVTVQQRSESQHTYMDVCIQFNVPCYNVTWGIVNRTGNTFYVDAQILRWTGYCIQIYPAPFCHTYELGILPQGNYTFVFSVWGTVIKSVNFSPDFEPGIDIQPRTFTTNQQNCFNVNIDSCGISVMAINVKINYTGLLLPPSLLTSFTSYKILGSPALEVGFPNIEEATGMIDYAQALPYGAVPKALKGVLFTMCFEFVPAGEYQICFEGVLLDSSGNPFGETNKCVDISVGGCTCIHGDCDCDCDVDFLDFVSFTRAYNNQDGYKECLDFDENGIIDFFDFVAFTNRYGLSYCDGEECSAPWCEQYQCRKGDCDCDCDIDTDDLLPFVGFSWDCIYPGSCYQECLDFDNDGDNDLNDYNAFSSLYGITYCDCDTCSAPPWEPWQSWP